MTLSHDALVNNSASYSEGPGFESRSMPILRLFLAFLSPSRQVHSYKRFQVSVVDLDRIWLLTDVSGHLIGPIFKVQAVATQESEDLNTYNPRSPTSQYGQT